MWLIRVIKLPVSVLMGQKLLLCQDGLLKALCQNPDAFCRSVGVFLGQKCCGVEAGSRTLRFPGQASGLM